MNKIKQSIPIIYFILIMFMSLFIICESKLFQIDSIGVLTEDLINVKKPPFSFFNSLFYSEEKEELFDYEYFDLSYDDFAQVNEQAPNYIEEKSADLSSENTEDSTTDNTPVFSELVKEYEPKIVYSKEQLSDYNFLTENCYIIDSTASVKKEELDINTLLGLDTTLQNIDGGYKVLIYHTHGSESFADSREGVLEDSVVGLGDVLEEYLESYGISVYHDRTIYDYQNGVLDRSKAYDLARDNVDKILAENPSIEVVLDIHRDGVREDVHLVTEVDGVKTAKIMFVNGVSRSSEKGDLDYLYNPNKLSNLSFSLKMHLKGKELFGELMRKIYVRAYCFNLDCVPKAALVEVGAQTNTVEEAKNAMKPLSLIIYSVLTEK